MHVRFGGRAGETHRCKPTGRFGPTLPEGASLYMLAVRRAGDVEAGGGGEGSYELLGGTGRFDGVGGTCDYETDYLAGDRFVTIARCAWEK